MRPVILIHVVALAVSAAASAAQVSAPEGASVVHGRVLDAASGRGVPEAWVCARVRTGEAEPVPVCTSADSAGRYRLASLPAGSHPVAITCPTDDAGDRTLAAATLALPDSATVERDWRVPSERCRRGGSRLVRGDFGGHYTSGFETSHFVPCPADRWAPGRTRSDGPADPRRAWVTPRDTTVFAVVVWPPNPADEDPGAARYFVRWRGTVEGPGRYGHLGAWAYRLTVDSVMEVRAPAAGDCEGPGRPTGPGSP